MQLPAWKKYFYKKTPRLFYLSTAWPADYRIGSGSGSISHVLRLSQFYYTHTSTIYIYYPLILDSDRTKKTSLYFTYSYTEWEQITAGQNSICSISIQNLISWLNYTCQKILIMKIANNYSVKLVTRRHSPFAVHHHLFLFIYNSLCLRSFPYFAQ